MKFKFLPILVLLVATNISCNKEEGIPQLTIPVELSRNEPYEYNTGVGGDEDGARIISQASRFEVSEIIRNDTTRFVAVYRYLPETDYPGTDQVELELSTGSDGSSGPTRITRVLIQFNISD